MRKMKKEKVRYHVLFVPDKDTQAVKFSVSLGVLVIFFMAVVFVTITALSYCFIVAGELEESNLQVLKLKGQLDELSGQNAAMQVENEELQEKVVILSDTVNGKVQKEQEREAEIAKSYIPTGYPVKGSASYSESETELDGNPIAVFQASPGVSVIATANGEVSSIAGDDAVGFIVMVNHGNGYYSVYRNGTSPKVKEGETVTNTTVLFDMEAGHETLGYQMIENERFIDPLSLMETYG